MRQVFYNGIIITMESEQPKQAVLVEDGIIKKVGESKAILQEDDIIPIDLKGCTLLPAFLDAHSHLSSYANTFLQASLEKCTSFREVIIALQKFEKENNVDDGQWLIGNGYDHNLLIEKSHPSSNLLDQFFPKIAVALQHKSGHFGVFNSLARKKLGLQNIGEDGYVEENSYIEAIKKLPMPDAQKLIGAYQKAMNAYASYGITTIQEGMMVEQMISLYQMLLLKEVLFLDVVGYPQVKDGDKFYERFPQCITKYDHHFRLGGYKIILDGSPQGRTAWMKTSYNGDESCYGVQSMSDREVDDAIAKSVKCNCQLLAHCNGDAAAEQYLNCLRRFEDKDKVKNIRPVMIHAQLVEGSQLDWVRQLGVIPSFFVAHCYYWGDTHIENFGLERASKISPAKSALDKGILFTFHQDTPVIEPDMLQTIWCAVNRKTKEGILLGKEERIPVWEALKAITINAAYQYGEEEKKGSIAPGKNADFVVLDQNPLAVSPGDINKISVLKTYHLGSCIFER